MGGSRIKRDEFRPDDEASPISYQELIGVPDYREKNLEPTTKQRHQVSVGVTTAEKKALQTKAKEAGLSLCMYIRKSLGLSLEPSEWKVKMSKQPLPVRSENRSDGTTGRARHSSRESRNGF